MDVFIAWYILKYRDFSFTWISTESYISDVWHSTGCEDLRGMELARDRVQWWAFVSALGAQFCFIKTNIRTNKTTKYVHFIYRYIQIRTFTIYVRYSCSLTRDFWHFNWWKWQRWSWWCHFSIRPANNKEDIDLYNRFNEMNPEYQIISADRTDVDKR
jgi:hypothetical protein